MSSHMFLLGWMGSGTTGCTAGVTVMAFNRGHTCIDGHNCILHQTISQWEELNLHRN